MVHPETLKNNDLTAQIRLYRTKTIGQEFWTRIVETVVLDLDRRDYPLSRFSQRTREIAR